jgi:corrinoid protein of di/trimethylamine methyltransferase
MSTLEKISTLLQEGQAQEVVEMVQAALDEGIDAKTILGDGLMAAMDIIGEKFKNDELYIPEVLIAARAMNSGVAVLKPLLVDVAGKVKGKVVLGTVEGDTHDIGKNMVNMFMGGKGLEIIDLGTDVSVAKFIDTAREQGANIIACSALLTTTMERMKELVEAVNASDIRTNVKIMIGGAPVTEKFCAKIGADFYRADAASAAETAVQICAG